MNKVYKLSMAAIAASLVLVNCSSIEDLVGGDDESVSPTFTGQFVDTYVKGLNYTCTGWLDGEQNVLYKTGVTNAKGEFTCNEGDLVEFSVGSYVIGSDHAYNNPIKSPYDMKLGSTTAIINLAQLLQTLDDKTTDGVLTIPENFTALNDVSIKLDDVDFDALMADELNVASLVSEDDARAHLDESLGRETIPEDFVSQQGSSSDEGTDAVRLEDIGPLANVPLYYSDRGGVTAITFNSDFTRYSLTYSSEEVRNDLAVYGVHDTKIYLNVDNTYMKIEQIARDYIVIRDGNDDTGYVATETRKMYFNPADVLTTTALPLLLQDIGTIPYYYYYNGALTAKVFSERFTSYTHTTSLYTNTQFITKIDGSKLHINPAEYIEIIAVVAGVYVDFRHMQMNGGNWEVRYETRMYSTIETASTESTCYNADSTIEIDCDQR